MSSILTVSFKVEVDAVARDAGKGGRVHLWFIIALFGEFAEGIRVLFQYIPLKVLLKGNISTFIQIAK